MAFYRRLLTRVAASLSAAILLAFPATASALDLGVKAEPGIAVPLNAPQSQRFNAGGEASFKAFVGLGRYFDLQAGVSFLGLGAVAGSMTTTAGTAWSDSLGLRLQRPHDLGLDRGGFYAASPWIDADALYVRTGGLDRFGLTAGAGVSLPLDTRRHAWLGPFVRYMQIVQTSHAGFDDADARLLFLGLNLEIGTSPLARHLVAPPVVECPYCAPAVQAVPIVLDRPDRPDRDHDGVPDAVDNCPDIPGPVENQGCPTYKKVVVKADKLELTEKIMFAYDKALIEPVSVPLLDEVVQALTDHSGLRVRIEGHTDSSGPVEHNQTLSEERAEAVLAYVRDHGIAAERLSSRGFGSTVPTDTNQTVAGREANRRVDFVVQFKIVDRSAP